MRTALLSALLAPALLSTTSFRPVPLAAANTFSLKVNGKALSGKPGFNTCLLMMNALSLGGPLADGSYVNIEIMPAAFPKLPATLPLGVQSLEKYVKIFYYPKGIKDATNYYISSKGGTLTVTGYNAAARTISGTFTGKVVRLKGTSEVPSDFLQLTDGKFDVAFNKM